MVSSRTKMYSTYFMHILISTFLCTLFSIVIASAIVSNASAFNAGKIVDDAVFTNTSTMNASQIQTFLNNKVSICDTYGTQPSEYGGGTRSEWAQANYGQSTFICLKNYIEGGRSAAQIIYDTAIKYQINPQVLIVLLQKEQGLVTDTWPLNIQYRSATGYGCPDTAPCDSQYYGLTNQLDWAAKMFRSIMNASPTWYTPYILGNNFIRYNPSASCGGSTVNIENRSTQALYNYTPYQPNAAALAAPMGTTVTCGAYGNLNFYRYFTSWFGSTTGPANAWQLNTAKLYYDIDYTQEVAQNNGVYTLRPGQKAYAKVVSTNIGRSTWPKANTRLGTQGPQDRFSAFSDDGWIAPNRAVGYMESGDIAPNATATYKFSITAPQTTGMYYETFSIVMDGVAWLYNTYLQMKISVPAAQNPSHIKTNTELRPGGILGRGNNILSPEGHSVLHFSFDGNLELWTNHKRVWTSNTAGSGADRLINQAEDGNMVIYRGSTPVWSSGTSTPGTSATLKLQADGNLVLYKNSSAVWSTGTVTYDQTGFVNSEVSTDQVIFPGQSLYTPNRYYRLTAQEDGNIVLYTPYRAIWASNTFRRLFDRIIVQGDGNIVAYNGDNYPIWSSRTNGTGSNIWSLQEDGNLVLYSPGRPTWATNTFMVR